jgi:hypothetical protein
MTYLQNTLGGNFLKDFESKIGEKNLLGNDSISKRTFLFNISILLSTLQFHWMILAFLFIVTLEAIVINFFLKDLKTSYYVAFITNLVSTLVAIPILVSSEGLYYNVNGNSTFYSSWLIPIIIGYRFLNPTLSSIKVHFVVFLFYYTIAFFLTIIIEYNVIKMLISRNKDLKAKYQKIKVSSFFVWTILVNIVSYLVVFFSFLLLGMGMALVSTSLNPLTLLESFFIHSFNDYPGINLLYFSSVVVILPFYALFLLVDFFFFPVSFDYLYHVSFILYCCLFSILFVYIYKRGNRFIAERPETFFSEIAQLVKHPINYFLFVFFASYFFGMIITTLKWDIQIDPLFFLLVIVFISIFLEFIHKYQKKGLLTLELTFKFDRKSLFPLGMMIAATLYLFFYQDEFDYLINSSIIAVVLTILRLFLRESTEDISE